MEAMQTADQVVSKNFNNASNFKDTGTVKDLKELYVTSKLDE